jgi:hypothetical protein
MALISGATLLIIAGAAYLIFMWRFLAAGDRQESASEIVITPEYLQSMRSAGYPISISRAFQASSYGGWHGDGASLEVYRYPASESAALLAALKVRSPDYVWSDTTAKHGTLGDLKNLLPREFLPSSDSATVSEGRPAQDLPLVEYVVCPSAGLLYLISNRF